MKVLSKKWSFEKKILLGKMGIHLIFPKRTRIHNSDVLPEVQPSSLLSTCSSPCTEIILCIHNIYELMLSEKSHVAMTVLLSHRKVPSGRAQNISVAVIV